MLVGNSNLVVVLSLDNHIADDLNVLDSVEGLVTTLDAMNAFNRPVCVVTVYPDCSNKGIAFLAMLTGAKYLIAPEIGSEGYDDKMRVVALAAEDTDLEIIDRLLLDNLRVNANARMQQAFSKSIEIQLPPEELAVDPSDEGESHEHTSH